MPSDLGRVTCRSVELPNLSSSLRPAEWRYQDVRWHTAQSGLSVQMTAGVSALAAETTLLRQVMVRSRPGARSGYENGNQKMV